MSPYPSCQLRILETAFWRSPSISHRAVRPLRGRCLGAGSSAGRARTRFTRPRATHGYFIDRSAVADGTASPPIPRSRTAAAIAVVNDLVLVTANVPDYEQFAGLSVENWHS